VTVASYTYDSQNRRISKTVAGMTTHYIYDLANRLIAETLADGTPIRDFFYLDNEPLAVREYQTNPGLYYFLNDHLGTPQQLITPAGAVVWQAAYLPYGEAQVQVNTVVNNLRFPGQYFDSETGLHYNWNRYYDPITGHYISADPIGLEGGLNLYAYVGGNPVNWSDPWGLVSCTYSISSHTMTCTSNAGGKSVTVGPDGVFSGNGPCKDNPEPECIDSSDREPIVPRNYNMNKDDREGQENFWRLEPNPKISGWKCLLGFERCGFEFHPGGRSLGCITVDKTNQAAMKQYGNVNNLLNREVGSNRLRVVP